MDLKTNALVITDAIKRRGVKRLDLCKTLGISERTLRKWVSGKCRIDQYDDVCSALGLRLMVVGEVQSIKVEGHFVVTNYSGKA